MCPRRSVLLFVAFFLPLVALSSNAHAARGPSPAAGANRLTLVTLLPSFTWLGDTFNYQPRSRSSALAVVARGAQVQTRIVFDGRVLATAHNPHVLTALVPTSLLNRPGRHPVYLQRGATKSNRLQFIVYPRFTLLTLLPSSIKVGERFNYQSRLHESALAVLASGAIPGTTIVFSGRSLSTAFNGRVLTAGVPPDLVRRPGTYTVFLKIGSKLSNKRHFVVRP